MNTLPHDRGREPYLLAWLNDRPPVTAAFILFGIQALLFLIGVGVDQIVGGTASYGFLGGMGLFAGLILLDALSLGMAVRSAIVWAIVVTLGTIFGALPYTNARRDALR
jgi:hypothetical protein